MEVSEVLGDGEKRGDNMLFWQIEGDLHLRGLRFIPGFVQGVDLLCFESYRRKYA